MDSFYTLYLGTRFFSRPLPVVREGDNERAYRGPGLSVPFAASKPQGEAWLDYRIEGHEKLQAEPCRAKPRVTGGGARGHYKNRAPSGIISRFEVHDGRRLKPDSARFQRHPCCFGGGGQPRGQFLWRGP